MIDSRTLLAAVIVVLPENGAEGDIILEIMDKHAASTGNKRRE